MDAQRPSLKPLTRWAIACGCTLRFLSRAPGDVRGVARMPDGEHPFIYDPTTRTLTLEGSGAVTLNDYGWEVSP